MRSYKIEIQKAKPNDSQEIVETINAANKEAFGRIIPEEHFREPVITNEELVECIKTMTFYVHKKRGRIVGVAALKFEDDTTGRIRWVYILPNQQRKGIGTALIKHIEEKARDSDLRRITVMTDGGAEWALAFYKRLGYEIFKKVKNPWGFDVWMHKWLV